MRQLVLNGLSDFGFPVPSRLRAAWILGRVGCRILATQFGTLIVQERQAFVRGGPGLRPVWLCRGRTADSVWPVMGMLARSDRGVERAAPVITH